MDDIIIIKKLLENPSVSLNGVSETVKHEIKTIKCISWYVMKNFRRFDVRKYVNWKMNYESRKRI